MYQVLKFDCGVHDKAFFNAACPYCEIERLREDAARYRWLRAQYADVSYRNTSDECYEVEIIPNFSNAPIVRGGNLDVTVDDAMRLTVHPAGGDK